MSDDGWDESSAFEPRAAVAVEPSSERMIGKGRGFIKNRAPRTANHGDNGGSNGFREKTEKRSHDNENGTGGEGGDGEARPRVEYIPPAPTEDDAEIYGNGLNAGINFQKYDKIEVQVSKQEGDEEDIPTKAKSFEELGLRPFLLEILAKCGYKNPTPVQKTVIPIIMRGRDVMACAQTGSGKTAAFLLPIVNSLLTNPSDKGYGESCTPQALIVSPTRELAIQIFEECRKFVRGSALTAAVVYGGVQVYHQRRSLEGANIIVATPGRLLDFVERQAINFSDIRFVVLDEADRMLDMGFKPSIEKVMHHGSMTPMSERQTLMFSATFPPDVQKMAREFLAQNYLFATIGIVGGACSDVEQRFVLVESGNKRDKLLEIIKEAGNARTLVFVGTQRYADMLSVILCEIGISTTSIHGAREQRQREEALRDFRSGVKNVLVATGVASRGLDIKGVEHVINYDFPNDIDEYVHRIGRTGRLGNRGLATTFFNPESDSQHVSGLVNILKSAEQDIPDFFDGYGGNATSYNETFGGVDTRKNTVVDNEFENDIW